MVEQVFLTKAKMSHTLFDMASGPEILVHSGLPLLIVIIVIILAAVAVSLIRKNLRENQKHKKSEEKDNKNK